MFAENENEDPKRMQSLQPFCICSFDQFRLTILIGCNVIAMCNVYETIHTLFTASDSNISMVPLFLVASNERIRSN